MTPSLHGTAYIYIVPLSAAAHRKRSWQQSPVGGGREVRWVWVSHDLQGGIAATGITNCQPNCRDRTGYIPCSRPYQPECAFAPSLMTLQLQADVARSRFGQHFQTQMIRVWWSWRSDQLIVVSLSVSGWHAMISPISSYEHDIFCICARHSSSR